MPRTAKEVAAYSLEHPNCADPYHCGKIAFRGNRWSFESVCQRCAIVEMPTPELVAERLALRRNHERKAEHDNAMSLLADMGLA